MAEVLILDAEALSALAHAKNRGATALRARAVLTVAHEMGTMVRVPVPVLAEVYRGGGADAAVDRVLAGRGIATVDLTRSISRHAGRLLGRAKLDSTSAVDAFVVATAATFGSAVIATHDPDDLRALAAREPGVRILPI